MSAQDFSTFCLGVGCMTKCETCQHEEGQATLTPNQRAAVQHCLIHLRAVAAHNGPMMEAAIVQVATEILLRQATAELAMIRAKAH